MSEPVPQQFSNPSFLAQRRLSPREMCWAGQWLLALISTAVVITLAGCGSEQSDINTNYGQRSSYSSSSVNGTSVLSQMFAERGHRVSTEKNITPSLHKYDTIVWFPQDYGAPTLEQRKFFEAWLRGDDLDLEYLDEGEIPYRLLVFVGRDYDAEAFVWGELARREKSEMRTEFLRRQGLARKRHRESYPYFQEQRDYHRWFTTEKGEGVQRVTELSGDWVDTTTVDADKVAMEFNSVLGPTELEELAAEDWTLPNELVMLEANGQPFVRNVWDEDMINENGVIVVNNGSFLLNAPLVNKENRKLAGKLIDVCEEFSSEEMEVAFLETDSFDNLPASEEEEMPTGLEAFTAWPLAPIVWHLTFLGIALCFCLLPIFGRPRQLLQDDQTDFGRHVAAVARLLRTTGDQQYAQRQIDRYRHNASRRD